MSTIAEKVPDIEITYSRWQEGLQKQGDKYWHQQYLKDVSGKVLYNISLASTRDMAVPNCKGAWEM